MADVVLHISGLIKKFGDELVLRDVAFDLMEGEVLSILGTSGSGKTTLLKIIAGLENEDTGEMLWKNERINEMSPQQRGIVYLYQEPLLFPHLTVFENIAFGLRLRRLPDEDVSLRVNRILSELGIEEHAQKSTDQLSGGQRQRVAFGRALIIEPKLILLDEPFGALDHETRGLMQILLRTILVKEKMTAIFVTHDLKEAIQMGSRIGKMKKGRLKIYENKQEFINDPDTGARKEGKFWTGLLNS